MMRAHADNVDWTVNPSWSKGARCRNIKMMIDGTMYILDAAEARSIADRLHDVAEEIEP